tara:strand:+ start:1305 stop:1451 length:147 start_codon:yes stop_codon:yes gene_type:complete
MFGEEKLLLGILIVLNILCAFVYSVEDKKENDRIEKNRVELLEAVKNS